MLREDIFRLEKKIVVLRRQLRASDLSPYERNEKALDLVNAEEALELLHKAYELEQRISN